MKPARGVIAGASLRERSVRLAGFLAESAQGDLVLSAGGEEARPRPRETDLPAMLDAWVVRFGTVEVFAPGMRARFILTPERCGWECEDDTLAGRLHVLERA